MGAGADRRKEMVRAHLRTPAASLRRWGLGPIVVVLAEIIR